MDIESYGHSTIDSLCSDLPASLFSLEYSSQGSNIMIALTKAGKARIAEEIAKEKAKPVDPMTVSDHHTHTNWLTPPSRSSFLVQ